MLTGTLHTQHRSTPRDLVAKALPRQLPDNAVVSVLTRAEPDLAGDIVVAAGLDFGAHRADPWVDLEHGLDPDVGRKAIGWATPSLGRSGGSYSVTKCVLDGQPTWVGVTYFDLDNTLQRQVRDLVRNGALPGVSLEFKPDWSVAKSLGASPLERRDAFQFNRASVVRWTHCVEPVCPGAVTVLKSLPPELGALAKVMRDRTVSGEALHPYILKSLARYMPTAILKSFDEGKTHRDSGGRFSSTGGGKMPHVHTTPQTASDYRQQKQARLHNLTEGKVKHLTKKTGASEDEVRAELDAHAGHGDFPHIHTTPEQVKQYKQWREMGTHNLADSLVESIARKRGVHPDTVAAELNHHASRSVGKAMEPNAPAALDTAQTAYDPDLPDDDAKPALNGVSALYNHAQALLDAADQLVADMESSDAPELRKMGEKLKAKVEAIAEEAKGAADKHDAKLNGGGEPKSEPPAEGEEGEEEDAEPDMDTDEDGTLKAIPPQYRSILKAARARRYTLAEVRKGIEAANLSEPIEDEVTRKARERAERELGRLRRDVRIYAPNH